MAVIWASIYRTPSNEDYSFDIFEDRSDAEEHTVNRISRRLRNVKADNSFSEYHHVWVKVQDCIADGCLGQAISIYNSAVADMGYDDQIYYEVMDVYLQRSSTGKSKLDIKSVTHYRDGADCKKCKQHNEYIEKSNQDDGTYLCGTCQALGSVFG